MIDMKIDVDMQQHMIHQPFNLCFTLCDKRAPKYAKLVNMQNIWSNICRTWAKNNVCMCNFQMYSRTKKNMQCIENNMQNRKYYVKYMETKFTNMLCNMQNKNKKTYIWTVHKLNMHIVEKIRENALVSFKLPTI